ncbi:hypothetical protein JXB12_06625 [candidate division KSB1 bacterium]|nr:hypothetical protein [candidate division KSB1 bacterium]
MPVLKKLKGLVWRDGVPEQQESATEAIEDLKPLQVPTVSLEAPAEIDSQFFSEIEGVLNNSMPIEFAEFYNQMSVINDKFPNLDEATRYQLAFHASQTALKLRKQNLTPTSLIKSIIHMEKTLDAEKREFQQQNDLGYQSNLTQVQKRAQEMSQGIKDRENRLQSLQKEIDNFLAAKTAEKKRVEDERAQLISQRVVAEGEINQLQQKKSERETQFNAALEAHRKRLETLKSELEGYLKNIEA